MSTENADRLKELRTALAEKTAETDRIIEAAAAGGDKEAGVQVDVTAEMVSSFEKSIQEIGQLRTMIDALETSNDAKEYLATPERASAAMAALAAGGASGIEKEALKSVGQLFVESEEFRAMQGGKAGLTMQVPFEMKVSDIARYGQKDVYTTMPTGTPARFGSVQRDAMVPMPQRRIRVRDLFPVQSTTASIIEYFRVTGFTNAASVVPERVSTAFGLKPQSGLTFKGEQTFTHVIAHWEAAHRTVLEDEPQLRALIDNELLYGLQLVEDNQILNGTGSGEDLRGILQTTGVQTYSWSAGANAAANGSPDNKADAIRRAATKVMLSYFEPTGVVVHDNDWEDIELTKDDNGQYLLAVSIALGGEPRVWRMPVVSTQAIAEGTALVGAFGIGAQLYDREQATIRVAEQHSDFFVRNAVVVLAEERLALAVKRPESFVKVTFDHAPT